MEIEEVFRMEDRDGRILTMWRRVGGQLGEQFVASVNPNQKTLGRSVGIIERH